MSNQFNARDITWLAFNERVMQEAMDENVPLHLRIRFLGIFSNNLDEFFRVRVAGLKRAMDFKDKFITESFYQPPTKILQSINEIVIQQQDFDKTWKKIQLEMADQNIFIRTAKSLTEEQKVFVRRYFDEVVESNVIPILLHDNVAMPYLRDKSLYLGVAMRKKQWQYESKFAIIEIPSRIVGRFVLLPSEDSNEKSVMLLEDVITFNLPHIFSYFGYDDFEANCFKVTKDAEFDLDNDIKTTLAEKIEKGIKDRRKGKPTRFVFDKEMDKALLEFLIRKLHLSKKDSIIPGGKIHNFRHFMDFPDVFKAYRKPVERTSFDHPEFLGKRVTDVILKHDVLLSFPYHTYNPVIDLMREAAMDPDVKTIQITAYRLASNSKIVNALINAARNGKEVTVMLELRARFDEESNLEWKEILEQEGVKVLVGIPNKKVHAKLCVIKKRVNGKTLQYGFVSTGNFNEKTAKIYGDHLLMTSDRVIMADINKVFNTLRKPKNDIIPVLKTCKKLMVCPIFMREKIVQHIDREIEEARAGRKAEMIIKVNSLSDRNLIIKLYEAAEAGVVVKMIVRGIYCAVNQKEFKQKIQAISIVDEYLEHARVMYFYNKGSEDLYISSADWMTRNLDYRIEAAVKITQKNLKKELLDILHIQLSDNVKARILDKKLSNKYVGDGKTKVRSQIETYNYLSGK